MLKYKKSVRAVVVLAVCLSATLSAQEDFGASKEFTTAIEAVDTFDPSRFPKGWPDTVQGNNNPQLRFLSIATPLSEEQADRLKKFISTEVFAYAGPVGVAYTATLPSSIGNLKTLTTDVNKRSRFPSVFFRFSFVPRFQPIKDDDDKIKGVANMKLRPKWVNVNLLVEPICAANATPCSARLLWLLPNATSADTQDHGAVRVASALGELAGVVAPFFGGTTADEKAGAAASGLGILFRQLFPPRPRAVEYAYVVADAADAAKPCEPAEATDCVDFGWFHQERTGEKAVSLLGIHESTALFEVSRGVTSLKIYYRLLAEWNDDIGQTNAGDELGKLQYEFNHNDPLVVAVSQDEVEEIDLTLLTNFNALPLLLSTEVVSEILGIDQAEVNKLTNPVTSKADPAKPLLTVGDRILRSTLQKLLGASSAPAASKSSTAGSGAGSSGSQ